MVNSYCLLVTCLGLSLMVSITSSSNPCIGAVKKCCSSQLKTTPFRCFEINNCAGIIWGTRAGQDICERYRRRSEFEADTSDGNPVNEIRVRTSDEDEEEEPKETKSLSNCQQAILNCCEEDIQKFPFKCFEINLCPTLFWGKLDLICSKDIVNSIAGSKRKNRKISE